MALFGRKRDVLLFTSIAKEFIQDIVEQQIGYYKIDLNKSNSNLYGESLNKTYKNPVLINCLISRSDQETSTSNFGPDINRAISFAFLRSELKDTQIVPEIGDIIYWTGNYFEVDAIVENQLIVGKYPEYSLSSDTDEFGNSFSLVCYTHYIRPDKLNLIKTRL